MENYIGMNVIEWTILTAFNFGFIAFIAYDTPPVYNMEKPKTPYLGIGSSMDEYMWSMFYDYKIIVERFDRK
jgi:hypothetical protein